MNKYLKELVELNKYDKKLAELIPFEENIKKPVTKLENKVKSLRTKFETLEDEIKNLILKKSKNEFLIAELKEKLIQITEKSAKVKTAKEAKALTLEEDLAKEQIDSANEEIEKFEKQIGFKKEEKEELSKEIESIENEIIIVKNEIQVKLDVLENQKQTIFESKDKLVKQMDQNIYKFYEKIKKWAGNTAVSPVRKQACMGCFMKINNKTYINVIKGDEIVTCPHCGRVVYIENEEKE